MTATAQVRQTRLPACSVALPCAARSAAAARRLVRAALRSWHLDHLRDDGALVATELVANAVAHTRSRRVRVTVTRPSRDRVRISVVDASRALPARRAPGEEEPHGRGLALIEALTARWGADLTPGGKNVWGELIGRGTR